MSVAERTAAQLRRPADKRDIGGHGDMLGFIVMLETAGDLADAIDIELPRQIKCSTCRFLTPDFSERSPCWDCVTDERLPKWRGKGK